MTLCDNSSNTSILDNVTSIKEPGPLITHMALRLTTSTEKKALKNGKTYVNVYLAVSLFIVAILIIICIFVRGIRKLNQTYNMDHMDLREEKSMNTSSM